MTYKLTGKISQVGILTGSLQNVFSLTGTLAIKLVDENIYDVYDGNVVITPSTEDQVLATSHKVVMEDIHVLEIPTYAVSNEKGTTFYIG